jgi:hypothetical protein
MGRGMASANHEQESAVFVAITRAASNYRADEWFTLPSSQRTQAIYRELRRLDAAASGRPREVADQSAPARVRKSRSAV